MVGGGGVEVEEPPHPARASMAEKTDRHLQSFILSYLGLDEDSSLQEVRIVLADILS